MMMIKKRLMTIILEKEDKNGQKARTYKPA